MNLIQDHIEYLKDNPKGYWFKRKLYGYGWTPAKPAGWITLFVFLTFIFAVVVYAEMSGIATEKTVELATTIIGAFVLFLVVVWRTGEPPKWQWGQKESDDE
jgi:hypothetical protein